MDAIPSSLNTSGRAHLICAVEITGLASRVAARLYQVERFIKEIQLQLPATDQLKVGLVAFGAHRAKTRGTDDRVVVTGWTSDPEDVAKSLGKLGAATADDDRAAQIEDALAEIERRLCDDHEYRLTSVVIFGAQCARIAQNEAYWAKYYLGTVDRGQYFEDDFAHMAPVDFTIGTWTPSWLTAANQATAARGNRSVTWVNSAHAPHVTMPKEIADLVRAKVKQYVRPV